MDWLLARMLGSLLKGTAMGVRYQFRALMPFSWACSSQYRTHV